MAELITNGHWEVAVTYGVDIDEGKFEIAAVAVWNNAHDDLNNWVASAPTKSYPPPVSSCGIRMSNCEGYCRDH